jgi:hypothetical protein
MSKSNQYENDILSHYLNNATIAGVGDATGLRGSTTAGSLYVALHTADPGEAGTQATSEAAYPGYARVAVARDGTQFTVSAGAGSNVNVIAFPLCTGGSETELFWSIGDDPSGAGKVRYYGALGNVTPTIFTAATSDTFTSPAHTLAVDDRICFYPLPGSTFPTGVTEGTVYWVKTIATDTYTVSTTQGGATLDVTVAGAGIAQKVIPLAVSNGITPQFAASALVATED